MTLCHQALTPCPLGHARTSTRYGARGISLALILLLHPFSGLLEAQTPVLGLPAARASLDSTEYEGTILVYDVDSETYTATHPERTGLRSIPASTFKVFSSLVAIETGVIDGPDAVIEWDGVARERSELNRDLDLRTAFRLSAVPHYQDLVRRIGRERMQSFIDRAGYGNRDTTGGIDQFWLTGGLRISPREQVDFLVRLLRDELPFSPETMAMVREMMVSERTAVRTIRSKTGWAILPAERNVGWWIGWVETAGGTHVFATVLQSVAPDGGFGPAREGLTRTALRELGVLEPLRGP